MSDTEDKCREAFKAELQRRGDAAPHGDQLATALSFWQAAWNRRAEANTAGTTFEAWFGRSGWKQQWKPSAEAGWNARAEAEVRCPECGRHFLPDPPEDSP